MDQGVIEKTCAKNTLKVWRDKKNRLVFQGDESEPQLVSDYSVKTLAELFPGLSREDVQDVIDRYELKHAQNYALWLSNRYPQTKRTLGLKMSQRGYGRDIIDEVITRVDDLGYINEAAIAESMLRKMLRQGFSLRRFRQKAKALGIPESIIDSLEILEEVDLQNQNERLLMLAKKILLKIPEHKDKTRILARRLAARGYSTEEIIRVFQYLNFSCVDIDAE